MDLQALNEYLKSVVDLIPAQSYFPQSTSNNSSQVGKKRKNGKEKDNQSRKFPKKVKPSGHFMKTTSAHISECNDSDNLSVQGKKGGKNSSVGTSEPAQALTDLQKRLKDRLTELHEQRKPRNKSEEEITQIRIRRKKERTKLKLKARLKREQLFKTGSVAAETRKTDMKVSFTDRSSKLENSNGRAVFSKFDFREDAASKKGKKSRKNDLKSLLVQAESKKQKIDEMKENEPVKADNMVKRDNWKKALAKAEGSKVKDNPELLRKSLKKEQALKKQHAKKWKERDAKVEEDMRRRQEKRTKNIQARKGQMKQKKMAKRAKGLAKSVPGF